MGRAWETCLGDFPRAEDSHLPWEPRLPAPAGGWKFTSNRRRSFFFQGHQVVSASALRRTGILEKQWSPFTPRSYVQSTKRLGKFVKASTVKFDRLKPKFFFQSWKWVSFEWNYLRRYHLSIVRLLSQIFHSMFSVKFHIAHLYEVQGKYKTAKDSYENLLKEKDLPKHLKADICRQLGEWRRSMLAMCAAFGHGDHMFSLKLQRVWLCVWNP